MSDLISVPKSSDLTLYWETFIDPSDGSPYFYCEATRFTQYEVPPPPSILLPIGWQPHAAVDGEIYFFLQAAPTSTTMMSGSGSGNGGGVTCWDFPRGTVLLPEPPSIHNDLNVYWETRLAPGGGNLYVCEARGVGAQAQTHIPTAAIVPRGGYSARGVLPVLLPLNWYAALTSGGEVYFVRAADDVNPSITSWDLPVGSATAATLAAAAPAGRLARAQELLRLVMCRWVVRKRGGIFPTMRHRPWMFRKKEDDSYITLNPLERDVLRKVLRDPGFELIGVLGVGSDSDKFGFADIIPAPPLRALLSTTTSSSTTTTAATTSLWNAAFDPGSGKTYFFNVETKETKWALPNGGRVVARVVPRTADVVFRAKACKAAKEEFTLRLRAKKESLRLAADKRAFAIALGSNASPRGQSAIAQTAAAYGNNDKSGGRGGDARFSMGAGGGGSDGGLMVGSDGGTSVTLSGAAAGASATSSRNINTNTNTTSTRNIDINSSRNLVALNPRKEGWLLKNNSSGKSYKKRWIIVDAERKVIEWYESPPFAGEPPKNFMKLFGE